MEGWTLTTNNQIRHPKGTEEDKASLDMTAKRSLSQSLKGDCPKAKGAGLATSIGPPCLIPVYKLHGKRVQIQLHHRKPRFCCIPNCTRLQSNARKDMLWQWCLSPGKTDSRTELHHITQYVSNNSFTQFTVPKFLSKLKETSSSDPRPVLTRVSPSIL